jgi:DNA polymerase III subunit epsilon
VKPIVFFDIESTGTDPVKDRIITLHAVRTELGSSVVTHEYGWAFNPGIPIPAEASAIHGLTDETVKDWPAFKDSAKAIHAFFGTGNLAGFNITNFDTLLLWEEFHRAGMSWNLSGVNQIDACTIFRRKEERTLSAAVKFYLGGNHVEAHDAKADVLATVSVLNAQQWRYPDLLDMTREQLHSYSLYDEQRFDLAGKLILDADGDPVYAFGNSKGVKVKNDQGFARWMLSKDFPTETKLKLKTYLENLNRPALSSAARTRDAQACLPEMGE